MTDEELCAWLRDCGLGDFDEAADRIEALVAERDEDHANINLKADFIDATINQLAEMECRAEAAEAKLKEAVKIVSYAARTMKRKAYNMQLAMDAFLAQHGAS